MNTESEEQVEDELLLNSLFCSGTNTSTSINLLFVVCLLFSSFTELESSSIIFKILLNIKLSLTEFTVYNLPGPFKHLVTIEWEDRDSRNGSSRSRALLGLSRAFRASLVSAVKSCSVRTSECASTPRCFKPPFYHRWHKGCDQVPTPLIGSPLHRRAHRPTAPRYLLFRFISNVYPISTSYWRSRLNSHEDPFLFARVKGKWKYPRQSCSP